MPQSLEPLTIDVPQDVLDDLRGPAASHPVRSRVRQGGWVLGVEHRLRPPAGGVLGRRIRLARGREATEQLPPVPHRRGRHTGPLHPRAGPWPGSDPHHPWENLEAYITDIRDAFRPLRTGSDLAWRIGSCDGTTCLSLHPSRPAGMAVFSWRPGRRRASV